MPPGGGQARGIGLVQVYHLGGGFPPKIHDAVRQFFLFIYLYILIGPLYLYIPELFGRKSINVAMADFLFKQKRF